MLGAAFVVRDYRKVLKFEVVEFATSWAVVSVDSRGNRFLICDFTHAVGAEGRTSYLNQKLFRSSRYLTADGDARSAPRRDH